MRQQYKSDLLFFYLPSHAVLERPAESTAEPSPSYQTTGPFPDSIENRVSTTSTLKFLQQTQFLSGKFQALTLCPLHIFVEAQCFTTQLGHELNYLVPRYQSIV